MTSADKGNCQLTGYFLESLPPLYLSKDTASGWSTERGRICKGMIIIIIIIYYTYALYYSIIVYMFFMVCMCYGFYVFMVF
jgi:hypothetical protein